MFSYYYNESLRKLVVAFGSLFNDVYIVRTDSNEEQTQKIRVPLTYGTKEKFIRRLEEQSGISDTTKLQLTLPRLGFEITNIDYDPTRHLNKINKRNSSNSSGIVYETYQEVPYNIGFSLYAYTRSMDDNLQIIEQVIPYFNPEFIVTLNINSIDQKVDVPIVMGNVTIQEDYEGNFLDRRVIASSFNFTAKTRLYSKINEVTPITGVSVDANVLLGDSDNEIFLRGVNVTGSTSDFIAGDVSYYE